MYNQNIAVCQIQALMFQAGFIDIARACAVQTARCRLKAKATGKSPDAHSKELPETLWVH